MIEKIKNQKSKIKITIQISNIKISMIKCLKIETLRFE